MIHEPLPPHATSIDSAFVARVVREVLARLVPVPEHTELNCRLVTVQTIDELPANTERLSLVHAAVITPAARDEARRRGIELERGRPATNGDGTKRFAAAQAQPAPSFAIIDQQSPERAEAVKHQLVRRGVHGGGTAQIVLSDTPAADSHRFSSQGRTAVMIRSLPDVDRFAAELAADVWVLDMHELTLVAAVNTAYRIIQLGDRTQ